MRLGAPAGADASARRGDMRTDLKKEVRTDVAFRTVRMILMIRVGVKFSDHFFDPSCPSPPY
jgi:hypothetical protein